MVLFSVIDKMRDDYLYGAIASQGTLMNHTAKTLAEKYEIDEKEVQEIIEEYKWNSIRKKIWEK